VSKHISLLVDPQCCFAMQIILLALLRFYYTHQNRIRDVAQAGKPILADDPTVDLTDCENKNFRCECENVFNFLTGQPRACAFVFPLLFLGKWFKELTAARCRLAIKVFNGAVHKSRRQFE
jgi:hypothetical protein